MRSNGAGGGGLGNVKESQEDLVNFSWVPPGVPFSVNVSKVNISAR